MFRMGHPQMLAAVALARFDVNRARAGAQLDRWAAGADVTVKIARADCALNRDGEFGVDAARAGVSVELERSLLREFDGQIARAGAKSPVARGSALRADVSAAGTHADRSLHAIDFNRAGAAGGFDIAGTGLREDDISRAGGSGHSACDAFGMNGAAAAASMHGALDVGKCDVTGAGASCGIVANAGKFHVARACGGFDWPGYAVDDLIAGAGGGMKARLSGRDDFVADGDIAHHVPIGLAADGDGVAVLFDGRMLLDILDARFGVASGGEPVVVGVNPGVDFHLAGVACTHGDVSRAGGDVHVHGPVNRESFVEMAVSGRARRRRSHGGKNGKRKCGASELQISCQLHIGFTPLEFNGPVYGTQMPG